MWWGWHEGFGWWMWFGWAWMLIFWGVVIGLIVWGVKTLTGRDVKSPERDTPLEIAERRYALGEITREEFEAIKHTLAT
jgi:putative membrane protein